jgi:hypothetical protein
VADGSDDIGGPSAGIEESEVDELVWAVVVTDVSVDDEITSNGIVEVLPRWLTLLV